MINPDEFKDWLVKVGRDRVKAWKPCAETLYRNPFELALCISFQRGGLGDEFALRTFTEVRFRASRAKKDIYTFLKELEQQGRLDSFKNEIGISQHILDVVKGLLELESRYNLRNGPAGFDAGKMSNVYEDLKKIRGLGSQKVCHYIVYELIRTYNFPVPANLGLYDELERKLQTLGVDPLKIRPEEIPYLDAAVFDLYV